MSVLLWILLCLVFLAGLYLFLIAPGRKRPDASALTGWLYAHRGLHGGDVPENSLAAFSRAVEAGYGIELDVQLTRDGFLVVHHDASLKRVCGADLRICDITFEELCRHPLPDGSCVPLFSDVLTLVGGRVPLIVEVKHHGGAARNAASALQQLGAYGGPYCVESFHPLAVRWFRKHAPEVIRGQLAYGLGMKRAQGKKNGVLDVFLASLTGNALGRPDFVAHDEVSGNDLPTRLTRRMGAHLVAWTVRDPARMRALRKKYELQIFEGFLPDD